MLSTGGSPFGVAVTPDGHYGFAVVQDGETGHGMIDVLRMPKTASGQPVLVRSIPVAGPAGRGDDHAGRQVPAGGGRRRRGRHQRGPRRIRGEERGARHARRTQRHRPGRAVCQCHGGGDLQGRAVRVRDPRIRPASRRVQPRRRGEPRVWQRGLCRQHPARPGGGRPGRLPQRPLAVRDERSRGVGAVRRRASGDGDRHPYVACPAQQAATTAAHAGYRGAACASLADSASALSRNLRCRYARPGPAGRRFDGTGNAAGYDCTEPPVSFRFW